MGASYFIYMLQKMRKILTNWLCILERRKSVTLGLTEKSLGFVEKMSKKILTRRRKVLIFQGLFLTIKDFKNSKNRQIPSKKPWFRMKPRLFCTLFNKWNPLRIAQMRTAGGVEKNKRKIPPEKCEKFWQNRHKINFTKEKLPQISKFSPFCLDISKKVHTFASLFQGKETWWL